MSDFSALSTAASALYAHQKRIGVIGDNIANINTPGYAAQRVELGSIGSGRYGIFSGKSMQHGVDVINITRRRDALLESAYRRSGSDSQGARAQADAISAIESQLGSLGEGSFSNQLNAFFNSFDDLANEPADVSARHVALQRADQVASSLRSQAELVNATRADGVDRVTALVGEVNRLTESIAALNVQIKTGTIGGTSPNSLIGQRSEQLQQLSKLVDIDVSDGLYGEVNVSLDGLTLVEDGRSTSVTADSVVDPVLGPLGFERIIVTAPNGRELSIGNGEIKGHLTNVNTTIPGVLSDLNDFANQFVASVNAVHTTGFGQDGVTGRSLFTQTSPTAASVVLNTDLVDHPERLGAAATATGAFDGTVAGQMAVLGSSPTGPAAAYEGFVAKLGSLTSRLEFNAQLSEDAASHAESQLSSVVGVNLDEELTDLMASQRAYEAAARMVTAVDEMLRTLISNTGLVGR